MIILSVGCRLGESGKPVTCSKRERATKFATLSIVFRVFGRTILDAFASSLTPLGIDIKRACVSALAYRQPSSSPPWLPPVLPPPWLSPPSVMSSSPDAAAAAVGSTFCQLTSSENWRLNFAATVQPSRLLPLAAFSMSAVATFRVPRPSGDGYNAGGYIALWLTPQSRLAG